MNVETHKIKSAKPLLVAGKSMISLCHSFYLVGNQLLKVETQMKTIKIEVLNEREVLKEVVESANKLAPLFVCAPKGYEKDVKRLSNALFTISKINAANQ